MNVSKKKYSLILTKSFVPLKVTGVKRTMKYLINGQGKALDPETYNLYTFDEWIEFNSSTEYDKTIRTEKLWIMIPDIVVLNKHYENQRKHINVVSKKKVFDRDKHICGYCGEPLNSKNRTIDHIIPISRGGPKHSYKNVVSCCSTCNGIKDNKTPEEMGWSLKVPITDPRDSLLYFVPKNKWLETWRTFLPEMKDD